MQEEFKIKEIDYKTGNLDISNHQSNSKLLCSMEKDFRLNVERRIMQSRIGQIIDQLSGLLAFLTSILFVGLSYVNTINYKINGFDKLDIAICFFFLGLYSLKLYVAQHRIQYLFSIQSAIDLLVIIPILFLINLQSQSNFVVAVVALSRFVRMINCGIILAKYYKLGTTDVDRQINIVVITMILLMYISSGMFAIIENIDRTKRQLDKEYQIQFHESVYFVVVTLLTVGYGDIIPESTWGMLIVLFIVIFTIVLIPKQTNELLRLMSMQSRYRRTTYKSVEVRHILVTGYVGLQALKNFCEELFHQDHGTLATNAVILQQEDPHSEMEIFIQKYEIFLTYLSGNPLDERDLRRGDTHKAEACVLLTNKNSKSAEEEDHRNILTALAIKKYVYDQNKDSKDDNKHNIKLCMQLIKPESKILYYKSLNLPPTNDQLIIVEEIKMNLLAKSCFAPGLISMISNLFASAGDTNTDDFSQEWLKEYSTGMGHEIYRVIISENEFQGKLTFKKIADFCYTEFQTVVFALEIELKNQNKSIIRLNPSDFEFIDWYLYNYYLYIICEDESVAKRVQKLDLTDDKYLKHIQKPRLEKSKSQVNSKDNQGSQLKNHHTLNSSQGFFGRNKNLDNEEEKIQLTKAFNQNYDDIFLGNSTKKIKSKPESDLKFDEYKQENNEDQIGFSDLNPLMKDYDILSKPQTQIEVAEEKLLYKLCNHIVVCGIHSSIYHFILPLRAKYLKNYQQDIVIITPLQNIPTDIWESIARFPRIYLIIGSPLSKDVLKKAQIQRADKAVILGHDPTIKYKKTSEVNDEMIDAQSIFIYKAIKRCNPQLQILTELSYSSNIDFLLPQSNNKLDYTLSTLYAAGEVYIAAIIDTLTAQAFYNPHIVTILQQILVGRGGAREEQEIEITRNFDEKLSQSNLWQIMVPEECVNKTFDRLFKFLLERNLIALGLYRLPQATDNSYPYVYTNPDQRTTITYRDRVFVLGKVIPKDLILDYNIENIMNEDVEEKKFKKFHNNNGAVVKDFYGVKQQLEFNKQTSVISRKDTIQKDKSITDNANSKNEQKILNDIIQNQNQIQAKQQEEKETVNSLEFMTKAAEKIEQKLNEIESRIRQVKDILSNQDSKIRDEVLTVKKDLLKDYQDFDD